MPIREARRRAAARDDRAVRALRRPVARLTITSGVRDDGDARVVDPRHRVAEPERVALRLEDEASDDRLVRAEEVRLRGREEELFDTPGVRDDVPAGPQAPHVFRDDDDADAVFGAVPRVATTMTSARAPEAVGDCAERLVDEGLLVGLAFAKEELSPDDGCARGREDVEPSRHGVARLDDVERDDIDSFDELAFGMRIARLLRLGAPVRSSLARTASRPAGVGRAEEPARGPNGPRARPEAPRRPRRAHDEAPSPENLWPSRGTLPLLGPFGRMTARVRRRRGGASRSPPLAPYGPDADITGQRGTNRGARTIPSRPCRHGSARRAAFGGGPVDPVYAGRQSDEVASGPYDLVLRRRSCSRRSLDARVGHPRGECSSTRITNRLAPGTRGPRGGYSRGHPSTRCAPGGFASTSRWPIGSDTPSPRRWTSPSLARTTNNSTKSSS